MKQPQKIEQLFTRYLQNQCSPEEIKLLFQYFETEENESALKDLIKRELESSGGVNEGPETKEKLDQILLNIKNKIRKRNN